MSLPNPRWCDCCETHATAACVRHGAEDGFPSSRSAIRHPSHAQTRRYLAANPLPQQQKRTT